MQANNHTRNNKGNEKKTIKNKEWKAVIIITQLLLLLLYATIIIIDICYA